MTTVATAQVKIEATGASQAVAELNRVKDGLKETGTGAGGAASGLKAVSGALGALGVGISVGAVASLAHELLMLGGASQQAQGALQALVGTAAPAYLEAVARGAGNTVDSMEAARIASSAFSLGFADSASEMEEFIRIARVLGGTFQGLGTAQAATEMGLMLANMSVERLDTFGVSGAQVRARIEELQAATEGLSREMAFQQAFFEIASARADQLEGSMSEVVNTSQQLEAEFRNAKIAAGEWLANGIMPIIGGLRDLRAVQADAAQQIALSSDSWEEYLSTAVEVGVRSRDISLEFYEQARVSASLAAEQSDLAEMTELNARAQADATTATGEHTARVYDQAGALREAREAAERHREALEREYRIQGQVASSVEELYGQFDWYGRTLARVTVDDGDLLDATSRLGDELAANAARVVEMRTDLQLMGEASGISADEIGRLEERNAVLTGAIDTATAAMGRQVEAYVATQLSAEQAGSIFDAMTSTMGAQGLELSLAGARYDELRLALGLVTEGQLAAEDAVRRVNEAYAAGALTADEYTAAFITANQTGGAEAAEAMANAALAQQEFSAGQSGVLASLRETGEAMTGQLIPATQEVASQQDTMQSTVDLLGESFGALETTAPAAMAAIGESVSTNLPRLQRATDTIKAFEGAWMALAAAPRINLHVTVTSQGVENLPEGSVPSPNVGGGGGGGGGGGSGDGPGRAEGGPVSAGMPYMVGERGREMFVPAQDGMIVPHSQLGRGGGSVVINVGQIVLPGVTDVESFRREMAARGDGFRSL